MPEINNLQRLLYEEVFTVVESISSQTYFPKILPLLVTDTEECNMNILRAIHQYKNLGIDEDQIIVLDTKFDSQYIDAMIVRTKKEIDIADLFSNSNFAEQIIESTDEQELSPSDATKIIIAVAHKLETERKRYSICKEFCHLLFDKKKHITQNIGDLCNNLITGDVLIKLLADDSDDVIKSEVITHFIARELLMPYKMSIGYLESNMTSFEIANIFAVPEKEVDFLRLNWYMEIRKKFFEN